jgi:hypothetical protein
MIYKLDSSHKNFLKKLALSQYKKTKFPGIYKAWKAYCHIASVLYKLKAKLILSHTNLLKCYTFHIFQQASNSHKEKLVLNAQSVQHFDRVRTIRSLNCWKLYAINHKRRVSTKMSSQEYIRMLERCSYSKIFINLLRSNKIYSVIIKKCVRSHLNKLIIKSLTGLLENCVNRKKCKEVTQRAKYYKLSLMKSIGFKRLKHITLCRSYVKRLVICCDNYHNCSLKIKVYSAFRKYTLTVG